MELGNLNRLNKMAKTTTNNNNNSGWSAAPQGAVPLSVAMTANDVDLKSKYPNWPMGGTATQLGIETKNFDNNATSPKGAKGIAQVIDPTLKAVEEQTGMKLDPHNPQDAIFIHNYLMAQNLSRTGGDVNKSLSLYNSGRVDTNNPETTNYVNKFDIQTGQNPSAGLSTTQKGPETNQGWSKVDPTQLPPGLANSNDGWQKSNPPPGLTPDQSSTLGSFARGAERAALPTAGGLAAFGPGFAGGATLGGMVGGPFAPITGAVGGLIGGAATSLGAGYVVNKAQDYLLNQFPETAKALGLSPEQQQADVQQHPIASELGQLAPQALALRPSLKNLMSAKGLVKAGMGAVIGGGQEAASEYAQTGELNPTNIALNAAAGGLLNEPTALGKRLGLGHVGVDSNEASNAAQKFSDERIEPSLQASLQPNNQETQLPLAPELFKEAGQASDQIRFNNIDQAEPNLQSTVDQNLANLREQARGEQEGIIRDSQLSEEQLSAQRVAAETGQLDLFHNDPTAAKVVDFNDMVQRGHAFTQGDLFNDLDQRRFDQYGVNEKPRALSKDEFNQTLDNLSKHSGTVFDPPVDRNQAYNRYLDTVSDKQGGLFDRPTIAKNFVNQLRDQVLDDKISSNPTIKRLQSQVDNLKIEVASNPNFNPDLLKEAQSRLQKAKANIKKYLASTYDSVAQHPMKDKDGTVELNMGLRPPQWMIDGIGKMLQAFHGLIFKNLSKVITRGKPSSELSFGKIVRDGIADRVSKEANRFEVQKNQSAVEHIQDNTPLGKFDAIKEWIPDDRPFEEVKPDLMAAPDMDSNWLTKNIGSQGGLWASAISKSPVVKWAYTKINGAQKAIDFQVKDLLTNSKTGLQSKMRALSPKEKGELYSLMDLNEGTNRFTEGELRARGYNEKQIDYYKTHFDVMDRILDQVNQTRSKINMPPIDPRIAYMSSRFVGDFRSLIYQKGTGHIVGFVGHDLRPMLNAIIKHIDEQNPGRFDFEKPTLNRPDNQHPMNMFQGYMNALDMLSKNDKDVSDIVESYRAFLTNDAAKMLGALKHAKDKEGIFGAEGKKSWETQKKNAEQGMQSQLKYAENMIKWSNMQDAANSIKQMMVDPDINKPNAKAYVKDYTDNAIGHTKSAMRDAMNGILNGIAERTGVGPSVFHGLNNIQKSALLQMWLGFLRIPHSMLTLTQFFQSNPQFARMVKARGIDDVHFWSSTLKGTSSSLKMMTSYLKNGATDNLNPIEKAIWDYNKTNGVFQVNLKNHLQDIARSPAKRFWDNTVEANVVYPELALRSVTFSTWTHALHDAGMPLKEALGTAESFTRGALVDYRPIERPLMYGKMGFLGDIASTLTRFKMNQLSQHIYFGKNALKKGEITPLVTLLGTSIAFAGASGLLGFAQANLLYNQYSKWILGKPDTLKAVFLRHLPDWANYGIFSQLGINMQGSYSNADIIPENPWAALFPTGSTLMDMGKSLVNLAQYHDKTTMKQLLYNFSPTSLKGFEENYMFSQPTGKEGDKAFYRPGSGELQSIRTPTEQIQRNLAFHPFIEARNYDVAGQTKIIAEDNAQLRERDLKRLTDIYQNRQPTPEELEKFRQDWTQHRGDLHAANELLNWFITTKTTQMQRARGLNPTSIEAARNLQEINSMKGSKK